MGTSSCPIKTRRESLNSLRSICAQSCFVCFGFALRRAQSTRSVYRCSIGAIVMTVDNRCQTLQKTAYGGAHLQYRPPCSYHASTGDDIEFVLGCTLQQESSSADNKACKCALGASAVVAQSLRMSSERV